MTTYPLLSIITFLPIVAALILALFLRGEDEGAGRNAKWLALVATVATSASHLALRPAPSSSPRRNSARISAATIGRKVMIERSG